MAKDIKSNSSKQSPGKFSSKDGIVHDPGRRTPIVTAPEGFDKLSYLDDEDKRVALENYERTKVTDIKGVEQPPEHAAVQRRNPYYLYQKDPKLLAADWDFGDVLMKLVFGVDTDVVMAATDKQGINVVEDDPEVRHRLNTAMLMLAKVAHEYRDEWTLRLVATGPVWTAMLSRQQYCLLDRPESVVWNDAQRLALQYTHAVVNREVTDELFARAEAAWGLKQMLRYTAWITRYAGMFMFDHVNISDAEKNGELKLEDLYP